MREILFRSKGIDNGEWCIGFYCQVADESDGGARVKHVIVVPTFKTQIGFLMYEVDPDTVGQYTGLTDKNGKKIFEGDIVRNHNGEVYEFGFIECYSRFALKRRGIVFGWSNPKLCEIIGNIHDNPELLEEQA